MAAFNYSQQASNGAGPVFVGHESDPLYNARLGDRTMMGTQDLDMSGLTYEQRLRYYDFLIAQHVHFEKDDLDGMYAGRWRVRVPPAPHHANFKKPNVKPNTQHNGPTVPNNKEYKRLKAEIIAKYPAVCRHLENMANLDDIKARRHAIKPMLGLIEEVYDGRFEYDSEFYARRHERAVNRRLARRQLRQAQKSSQDDITERSESAMSVGSGPEHEELLDFASFLVEFYQNKFVLPNLIVQNLWDIVYNTHVLRGEFLEMDVLGNFLEEKYSSDELQYFLHARHKLIKQLGIKGTATSTNPNMVEVSRIPVLLESVAGPAGGPQLAQAFMPLLTHYLKPRAVKDRKKVELQELLNLLLVLYHRTRPNMTQQEMAARDRDTLRASVRAQPLATADETGAGPAGQRSRKSSIDSGRRSNPGSGGSRRGSQDVVAAKAERSPGARSGPNTLSAVREDHLEQSGSLAEDALPYMPERLLGTIRHVSSSYTEVLMRSAGYLPRHVMEEIRLYVDNKLNDKISQIMADVVSMNPGVAMPEERDLDAGPSSATLANSPVQHERLCRRYRHELSRQFAMLARMYEAGATELLALEPPEPGTLDSLTRTELNFAQALMGTPDLRHDIEPMAAYLITCARKKLDEEAEEAAYQESMATRFTNLSLTSSAISSRPFDWSTARPGMPPVTLNGSAQN